MDFMDSSLHLLCGEFGSTAQGNRHAYHDLQHRLFGEECSELLFPIRRCIKHRYRHREEPVAIRSCNTDALRSEIEPNPHTGSHLQHHASGTECPVELLHGGRNRIRFCATTLGKIGFTAALATNDRRNALEQRTCSMSTTNRFAI